MITQVMANLKRYQPAVGYSEDNKVYICVQTHVFNKPWAICKFQKNVLENFVSWPPKTFFKIERV